MNGWLARVESVLEQVDSAAGAGANPRNSPAASQRPRLAASAPPQKPAAPAPEPQKEKDDDEEEQEKGGGRAAARALVDTLQKRVRSLELENEAQGEVVDALGRKLDDALRARDAALAAQSTAAATRADETAALQARVAALEGEVQAYAAALGTANAQVHALETRADAARTEAAAQAETLAARTAEVAQLQQALRDAQQATTKEAPKTQEEEEPKAVVDEEAAHEDTVLGMAARQLADAASRADADPAGLVDGLRAVVSAATTVLGAERVAAALPEPRTPPRRAEAADVRAEAAEAAEAAARRERDAAAAREEALRRETARLRTDVLAGQERLRTSEARAERLQRQLAAKAVLGAANTQLEARVRALTDAVAALQHENHRLQVAHGVTPAPVADTLARDTQVDCSEPGAARLPHAPDADADAGVWAVLDDTVLAPLVPLLCRTRRARVGTFVYAVAVHALLVLFFLVFVTR